jgi:hypothetical protein
LERFAPLLLLLAPGERALPANVEWFLARSRLEVAGGAVLVTQAPLAERTGAGAGRLRPAATARAGSDDPREWVTYSHAYRGEDGAWLLQYWFFYPFNDFHGLLSRRADPQAAPASGRQGGASRRRRSLGPPPSNASRRCHRAARPGVPSIRGTSS